MPLLERQPDHERVGGKTDDEKARAQIEKGHAKIQIFECPTFKFKFKFLYEFPCSRMGTQNLNSNFGLNG